MFAGLTGWHLLIVLAIVLLLFGAPKLPGLAKSLGQSMRIFRSEVKTMKDENADDGTPENDADVVTPPAATAPKVTPVSTAADTSSTAKPKK